MIEALQKEAHGKGFTFVVQCSNAAMKIVELCCDRFGTYTSVASKRKTATKKCGCTFALSVQQDAFGQWAIIKQTGSHNHNLQPVPETARYGKRLNEEQKQQRLVLQHAGVTPKAQLAFLRQEDPELLITARTVYNEKQSERRRFLSGRTPIQALFDDLSSKNFCVEYKIDAEGSITHFLFAHPQSVRLAQANHKVLLLDCTYKTNRYNMPLLICGGLTPSSNNFLFCGVFLKKEEQADYVWALTAIKKIYLGVDEPAVLSSDNEKALLKAEQVVFPGATRLLCRWHINKNVVKKCKRYFGEEHEWSAMLTDWNLICWAETELEFDILWDAFCEQFDHIPQIIEYLQRTWLSQREMFVECWVSKFLHLGCTTTSRVEGLHSFLKGFLSSSVDDLLTVTRGLTLAIEHQVEELEKIQSDDRVKRDFVVQSDLYNQVAYKISRHALKTVQEQLEKCDDTSVWTSRFTTSLGLPCGHVVKDRMIQNGHLVMTDFDSHWWLEKPTNLPVVPSLGARITDLDELFVQIRSAFVAGPTHRQLEMMEQLRALAKHGPSFRFGDPSTAVTRGRPTGALNKRKHDTRRDPSGFELVEGSVTIKRKCGACGLFGHNSRTCKCKHG